jgi:hypothetical protein
MRFGALRPALCVVVGLAPAATGCGISVDKDDNGHNKNVSITTPVGKVSVKADADTPPDTGVAVHAGARAIHDQDHDNANVSVEGGFFGVKVAVARYEDQADTPAILDYYRKELSKFGTVTECRGNLDFKDSLAAPRCKERSRDEMQLGAGSEHDNHIVSVKPRGNGSEFTLIHVLTGRSSS